MPTTHGWQVADAERNRQLCHCPFLAEHLVHWTQLQFSEFNVSTWHEILLMQMLQFIHCFPIENKCVFICVVPVTLKESIYCHDTCDNEGYLGNTKPSRTAYWQRLGLAFGRHTESQLPHHTIMFLAFIPHPFHQNVETIQTNHGHIV